MSDRPLPPVSITLGFLTVLREPSGWVGGYLVTNAWGRPLEFRLTTAVQPSRVQAALYGPTLEEYLHADLIGKTLVEKTTAKPDLIVADAAAALGLRSRVGVPTVALYSPPFTGGASEPPASGGPYRPFTHPRSAVSLATGGDEAEVVRLLDAIDPAVDLAEPFARIREAIAEARRTGGANRAA